MIAGETREEAADRPIELSPIGTPRRHLETPRRRLPAPRLKARLDPVAMRHCEAIQTRLWLAYPEGRASRVTVFVGATPRCGVSTVAANFAASLAHGGSGNVLLIAFGEPADGPEPGRDETDLRQWLDDRLASPTVANMPANMVLLTSASLGSSITALLQSRAFDQFLTRARERFEHVVVDAPALQNNPETLVLCRKADGVVLVVRAGRTRNQATNWARQQILAAQANLAGIVLNRRRFYIPGWIYRLL